MFVLLLIVWVDWLFGLMFGKYDVVILNVGVIEKCKEKYDFMIYWFGLYGFYVCIVSLIVKIVELKDIVGLWIIIGVGMS